MPKTTITIYDDRIVVETDLPQQAQVNDETKPELENWLANSDVDAARRGWPHNIGQAAKAIFNAPEVSPGHYKIEGDKISQTEVPDDTVWHQPKNDPELDKKAARLKASLEQRPKKDCVICGDTFPLTRSTRTLCGKDACKKEQQRRYAKKYWDKKQGKAQDPSVKKESEEAKWCKHCAAYTTHDSISHVFGSTAEAVDAAQADVNAKKEQIEKKLRINKTSTPSSNQRTTPRVAPELAGKEIEPETELRSACCDAKAARYQYLGNLHKWTHKCLACGHQCAVNEFLPGHEKSKEEIDEAVHQFKPIVPGSPGYSNSAPEKKGRS